MVSAFAILFSGTAFIMLPLSTRSPGLRSSSQEVKSAPNVMRESAWTGTGGVGVVGSMMMMAFGVAKMVGSRNTKKMGCNSFGTGNGSKRLISVISCKAEEGTSLLQRKRCDGHGFAKGDPEFDVTDSASLGE